MANATQQMNALLNPFLFQVIGSTPMSIRDSIKESGLRNKPQEALGLATVCVFAAAVNKATLESFLMKPEMDFARRVTMSNFTISGKVNMTGVTLLGHCLLTSSTLDGVVFVREFRHKMDQNDLWSGDFKSSSLSDKQKEILAEKKRVTDVVQAKLLGSGFFKYAGIDSAAWTDAEKDFWGETATNAPEPSRSSGFGDYTSAQTSTFKVSDNFGASIDSSPPRRSAHADRKPSSSRDNAPSSSSNSSAYVDFTASDGKVYRILKSAADYYMSQDGNTESLMSDSILRRGADAFNSIYGTAADRGLGAAATVAGSRLG